MRKVSRLWEYVAVYVDDLDFSVKDLDEFVNLLIQTYYY